MLLIVAVLLPTLGLSWMLARVVENERLAIRQKLIEVYERSLEERADRLAPPEDRLAEGRIAYDLDTGQVVFPVLEGSRDEPVSPSAGERHAARMELVLRDPAAARVEYERLSKISDDPLVRMRSGMGFIRCTRKMGAAGEADALTRTLLKETSGPSTVTEARELFNVRYAMLESMSARNVSLLRAELEGVLASVAESTLLPDFMPVDARVALMSRIIALGEEQGVEVAAARAVVEKEVFSAEVARSNSSAPTARGRFVPMKGASRVCGYVEERDGRAWVALTPAERVVGFIEQAFVDSIPWAGAICVVDPQGREVGCRRNADAEVLSRIALSGAFEDWTVVVLSPAEGAFAAVASARIALYGWVGTLLILLFIACGAAAVVLVGRQVRLNRMKNDFVATVSHELKTPLASTRVLMDTLLEGHYEMASEAREYLEMISRDNIRLTRLIDGFLTYSRMERGKQAFDLSPVEVEGIVEAVMDAMGARRVEEAGAFEVAVAPNVSPVLADADALTLVLVNLLDNAWKYAASPRQIRLEVCGEGAEVLFKVSDNGIGMTPRETRRIFEKFYQADQRLVREVAGCGLGLSIVKFVVDAHGGSIRVTSQPGGGSAFTVRLPKG
jgi:signal transduction histidine kinase